ncbi:nitrate/sulfonate/bicarbonate ABC transporter ATP-binding protein [Bifidobacterium bombi]|uniref:ABC transporter, ATP-binding protein n=1 Tax=Bifidobacterium bombi DSM 19703 TaxID=1341695 RepID=A0A080N309_9BIFI|nr:nitrate/sulfonate/bicarbonate ABC transporter ATP-binding protein [Bifidobacterium bombi]KFF31483.1 ABC transporter, ATP-binding protein [Bifidobacterium bombi DSM 19703]
MADTLTRDLNDTGRKAAEKGTGDAIIEANHVSRSFISDKGNHLTVLDDISLDLHEREVVAILGRSGAGKSTLLRVLAGLVEPTSGTVAYRGVPLTGANPGVALVFQTFALMPWLDVQANVELGLEARGVPRDERRRRALKAIDAIGLDGFESAYPKELSGGMKQRVGIARALVLEPDALFMDEPFSALDVLTAENLRQEVLGLWKGGDSGIKSILIVTHNIEEAVQMADRVVVLGSHPGRIIAEEQVNLPRPRNKHSEEFENEVDRLYTVLTGQSDSGGEGGTGGDNTQGAASAAQPDGSQAAVAGHGASVAAGGSTPSSQARQVADEAASQGSDLVGGVNGQSDRDGEKGGEDARDGGGHEDLVQLPDVSPGGLKGLIDVICEYREGADLSDLASDLSFEVDDLLPLIDAGSMLGVLEVHDGHATATQQGLQWHKAGILESKTLFAQLAMDHASLVRSIDQALRRSPEGSLRGELFIDLLRGRLPDVEAQRQFSIAVNWGRYGELFDYDADDDVLTLDTGEDEQSD